MPAAIRHLHLSLVLRCSAVRSTSFGIITKAHRLLCAMSKEDEALSPKSEKSSPTAQSLWDRIYTREVSSCLSYLIFLVFAVTACHVVLAPVHERNYNASSEETSILTPQDYASTIYTLVLIIAIGVVTGYVVQLLYLPSLLAMLLTGIILRNFCESFINVYVINEWSMVLRRVAFIVILLRGGLSLDANAVRRLKGACLRLTVLPCTAEICAVSSIAKMVFGMDILFGVALGAVLGAVSPAVVIPALLDAGKAGYGVRAGVPSVVIAAASLDDVYAITMFSLILSLIFPTGDSPLLTILSAPADVFAGVFCGAMVGFFFHIVPRKTVENLHFVRLSLLFSFSLAFLFGTARIRLDGAGAIGVLIAAFVAGHAWKKEGELPEEDYLALMWHHVFQPLLFGLIGLELSFGMISLNTMLLGVLVLAFGLVFRFIASFFAVFGSTLTMKERLFVAIAWMPKATVQAALAPVVLETARSRASSTSFQMENGILILTMAILSILITAPVGALAIRLATPVLLKKDELSEEDDNADEIVLEMN